jgi:hypothetical protein
VCGSRYTIPLFFILALDGGEWSASHPSRFTPGRICTHWTGDWVGLRTSLDAVEERLLPCIILKNAVFWAVLPCRSCVNRDVSEERIASTFKVEKSASEERAEYFRLVAQSAATCSRWDLARLFFYPFVGGYIFLRNVSSTRRHIAEGGIHSHRRENLKSYIVLSCP